VKEPKLNEAAAEELATVIGALLDAPAVATASPDAVPPERMVRLTFAGPLTGTLSVGVDLATARELARLIMALDDAPPDAAIADTLLEVCGQAIGSLGQRDEFKGLRLAHSQAITDVPGVPPVSFRISAGEKFTGVVCLWNQSAAVAQQREPAVAAPPPAPVQAPANLDVILDIDLPISVRFGETEMTLQSLTQIGPGSIIDLGRSPDDPVDVLVNDRLVARGEVVVVSGNYGVRITEVISAADRLRTMAG
jgi:flagellar motor switch protein FliN